LDEISEAPEIGFPKIWRMDTYSYRRMPPYFECSYNSRTCGNGIDFIGALIDAEPQSRVIDWLSAWPVHLVLSCVDGMKLETAGGGFHARPSRSPELDHEIKMKRERRKRDESDKNRSWRGTP